MANYSYRGRDAAGRAVAGFLEAASAGAAADSLQARGVTPLGIVPAAAPPSAAVVAKAKAKVGANVAVLSLFKQKIEHFDVLLFTKQLHTLLKAGVPIMRALSGLQESSANPSMKELLLQLRESLDSGRELSVSMARHPRVFTTFYLSMMRVGEMTGRLEEVLISLYHHLEFERFMREQVKSALRYPSFVIGAMVIALFVVNIFVIPAFAKVFEGFGSELPLMTRILLGFSHFMVNWWLMLITALAVLGLAFRNWIATRAGRYTWDKIKLSIPIAGPIIRKATLARFANSFAMASRSGVPIIQPLTNVSQTVDNAYIARKVDSMRDGVERGESILRTAISAGVFTPVVLQMIAVGEESGSLDEMMQEVADLYQEEVEYGLKTLAQQIEPIMITLLGILVLVLALGIFLPIWDLGKAAVKK